MRKTITVSLFGLLTLGGCLGLESTNKQLKTEQKVSAQLAMDAGLVDQPLMALWRYRNSSTGDVMEWTREMVPPGTEASVPSGYSEENVLWYILPKSYSGLATNNLYRLVNGNDRMPSNVTSESPYTMDDTLGKTIYAADSDMGLQVLSRWYKTGPNDQITAGAGETPPGYTYAGPLGYGWPASYQEGGVDTILKDGISIGFSYGWGGAITRISAHGMDWVNRQAAGRLVGGAMWYHPDDNPTEAGDVYNYGSPLTQFEHTSGVAGSFTSRSIGLQWGLDGDIPPNFLPDYSRTTPILSGTEFLKRVDIENQYRIKYTSSFIHAKAPYHTSEHYPAHEPLTAHLNTGLDFTHIRVYQWDGDSWEQELSVSPEASDTQVQYYNATSNNAILIVAFQDDNDDKGFALACPNPRPAVSGNPRTRLGYYRVDLAGGVDGSVTSEKCLKLAIFESNVDFDEGDTVTYTNYMVIGTLSQILSNSPN